MNRSPTDRAQAPRQEAARPRPPAPADSGAWHEAPRRGLHAALTHDLPAKLLALLAASVLWFYASEDRRAIIEQSYDVPVKVRDNTASGEDLTRAWSGLSPSTVKVTLSGRPERLGELSGETIEAVVDVTGIQEGPFNQPLDVNAPDGTEVLRVTPDRVQGLVDTVQTRTLPITVTVSTPPGGEDGSAGGGTDGTPGPHSAMMPNYQVQPAKATVSGPSRLVETVSQLIYPPVSLTSGDEARVSLLALDAEGQPVPGVTLKPAQVRVTRVDTGTLPSKRLPVRLSNPPQGLKVTRATLSPQSVRLVGNEETLSPLNEVVGEVEYREGQYVTPVRLLTPLGAEPLDDVTAELTVVAVETPGKGTPAQNATMQDTAMQDTATQDTPSQAAPLQKTPTPAAP